jgi:TonB family protein
MVSVLCRWPVLLVVLASSTAVFTQQPASIQPRTLPLSTEPLPEGQRVIASDGDTVVIEGDARVRIVRRRPAFVRVVANVEQRFVIVLIENLREHGDSPSRLSDKTYEFNGLQEPWPLAARWEGTVWLEEYSTAGSPPGASSGMLGIETSEGKIVFANTGPGAALAQEARTIAVGFRGVGIGGGGRQPFDQEEARSLAMAAKNAASSTQWRSGSSSAGFSSWMSTSTGSIGPPPTDVPSAPTGAVRVGGNVAAPRKLRHVEPATPPLAQSARLSGVVILEITIGTDGGVSNVRVLRSIPLLDQAAIDAVRQWQFEPTMLNGQAVPVIMTAPVSFGPP